MVVVAVYPRTALEPFLPFMTFAQNGSSKSDLAGSNIFTYFLTTFYVLLFLSGIIGNTWACSVIVSLFKNRSREPPKNVQFYILVLCIVDIIVLAFMPFTIDDMLHGEWTFTRSPIVCKLYLCSELISKFFAPFVLMALSGTCYMVVCKRQCRDFPDDLRAGFAVTTLAMGVLVVLMAPVYLYGDLYYLVVYGQPDTNGTSVIKFLALKCMFQSKREAHTSQGRISEFVLYTFIVGYAVPATAFCLFYILVWRFVRSHTWTAAGSLVDSWRVARTVLGLISFFLFCWTPYWGFLLYSNVKPQYRPADRNPITLAFAYITHLLPYINCLGYPIIYIVLNQKIKESYELIKAKRRSQILALCGFRKCKHGRREKPKEVKLVQVDENHVDVMIAQDDQVEEVKENGIEELEVGQGASSVSSPRSRSHNASIDNGSCTGTSQDSQSIFANVNELMELSRHLLIPLIQINDKEPMEGKRRGSSIKGEHKPDVAL